MTNYDESQVPAYRLPDPLVCLDGTPVGDAQTWRAKRRGELLELFTEHVFGLTPSAQPTVHVDVFEEGDALEGRAVRRQIALRFGADGPQMDLLVFLPAGQRAPVPTFLGLNFFGKIGRAHV